MILKKRNADALVGLDRGEAHGNRNCRDGKTVIATDDAARIRQRIALWVASTGNLSLTDFRRTTSNGHVVAAQE